MRSSRSWLSTVSGALLLVAAHAAMPSCAAYVPGTAVTLAVRGELDGALDVHGREVRIERAYLHVDRAELVPCEPRASLVQLRPRALADHGVVDGALDAGRFAQLHDGGERLGALSPGPGRYCALRVTLRPTEPSTSGVARGGYGPGYTIALEGEWQNGTERGPARALSAGNAVFEVAIQPPLEISGDAREASIELVFDLAAAFAEIDAAGDPYDVGLDLVARLDERATCEVRRSEEG